jgi:hypothetical protein
MNQSGTNEFGTNLEEESHLQDVVPKTITFDHLVIQ